MSITPSRLPSRPTTPLRRRSESRLSESLHGQHYSSDATRLPLDSVLTNPLVELNDALGDLDQNLQHLQLMHESITSFNESFSAFLYGIEMNAWCVEFPEAPTSESFKRERGGMGGGDGGDLAQAQAQAQAQQAHSQQHDQQMEVEDTYITASHDDALYDEDYEQSQQRQLAVPKSRLRHPSNGRKSGPSSTQSRANPLPNSGSRIPSYSKNSSRGPVKSNTTRQSAPTSTSGRRTVSKPPHPSTSHNPPSTTPWR